MNDTQQTINGFEYKVNGKGSYHRIIRGNEYEGLLNFYQNHIYIKGAFHNAPSLDYSETEIASIVQHERRRATKRINELKDFSIPIMTNSCLLELGCGCGAFLHEWENLGLGKAEGIEISNLVLPMNKRFWEEPPIIHIGELLITLDEMKKMNCDYFDVVAAFDVIEHLREPRGLCRLVYSVLQPDGRFLIEVPVIMPDWSSYQVGNFRLLYPQHHLHLFTPRGISTLLADVGFAIENATFSNDKSSYLLVLKKG